nr:MAG TPA: hypothetical protein [Caudoviricetes sp.]
MGFFGIKVITAVKSLGRVVFALSLCHISVPRVSERQVALVLNEGIICIRFALRALGGGCGALCGVLRGGAGTFLTAAEIRVIGHDFDGCAVLAVLVLILAGLQAAINGNEGAFGEILADKFCGLAPGGDIQPVCLAAAVGVLIAGIVGDAERADGLAAVRGFEFRVFDHAAHNSNNIQHRLVLQIVFVEAAAEVVVVPVVVGFCKQLALFVVVVLQDTAYVDSGMAVGADVNPKAQRLAGTAAAAAVDFMPGGVSETAATIAAERFMYEQRRRVAVLVQRYAKFIAGLHRLSVLSI